MLAPGYSIVRFVVGTIPVGSRGGWDRMDLLATFAAHGGKTLLDAWLDGYE